MHRPLLVTTLCWFLILASILGILSSIYMFGNQDAQQMLSKNMLPLDIQKMITFMGLLCFFFSGVFMLNQIAFGRNILMATLILSFFVSLITAPDPANAVVGIPFTLLAYVILYRPKSNQYFTPEKNTADGNVYESLGPIEPMGETNATSLRSDLHFQKKQQSVAQISWFLILSSICGAVFLPLLINLYKIEQLLVDVKVMPLVQQMSIVYVLEVVNILAGILMLQRVALGRILWGIGVVSSYLFIAGASENLSQASIGMVISLPLTLTFAYLLFNVKANQYFSDPTDEDSFIPKGMS